METELLIAGETTPAEGGRSYDRMNPISGELATRAAASSVAAAKGITQPP